MSDGQLERAEMIGGLCTEAQLYVIFERCLEAGIVRPLRLIPPRTLMKFSLREQGKTYQKNSLPSRLRIRQALQWIENEELQAKWNLWLCFWMPEFYEALFANAGEIATKINEDMLDDEKRNPALTKLWLEHRTAYLQALGVQEATVQEHVVRHLVSQEDSKNIAWDRRMPEADAIPLDEPTARKLLGGGNGADD